MSQTNVRLSTVALAISVVAIIIATTTLAIPYVAPSGATTKAPPQTREFTLVTDTIAINETIAGIPHDVFSPTFLHVNQGDTVIIHFINTEEADEHHTFTLPAYNIDVDLAQGQKQDIRFTASQAGIFLFYCKYHLPTMAGQLVVLSM